MKLGIFGGSFNPVHKMHEKIGNYLINKQYVDKVIFVPTGNQYKYKRNLVKDSDRYQMIELVCKKNTSFFVSDYELKDHVVYTIDTLRYYSELYPDDEIYFICGADNLSYIDKWKNGLEILSNYHLLVINRDTNPIDELLTMFHEYIDHITVVPMEMDDMSSTLIRKKIKNNEDVGLYLDQDVITYIKEHNLYKDGD